MPKVWRETIDGHRHAVRDAILDATAALLAESGLFSLTMSRVAEDSGIGRATLYKYFPDVEAILLAWHERQVHLHLQQLIDVRDRHDESSQRLEAVLEAFALISFQYHGTDLAAIVHRGDHIVQARHQLSDFITALITEGVQAGDIRDDVAPEELASYCVHALAAASGLTSKAASRRLVSVILDGLRRR